MEENIKYTPEQWVDYYQGNYIKNLTLDTATRIIKSDMTNMARTCVSIGFHLKAVKVKELFKDAGYDNIWDYAKEQFGLSMSSASRYMSINDQFSVGGNTPQLRKEYRNFNKSQLQEMLTMSEEQRMQVTEKMTVKEIRKLNNPEPEPVLEQKEEGQILGQMETGNYPDSLPEESVATSQKATENNLVQETCPPGIPECIRTEWGTSPEQQHEGQEECYCVEAPMGNPFSCQMLDIVDDLRESVGGQCQFVNHDLAYHRPGDNEPVPCCKDCDNLCLNACDRAKMVLERLGGVVSELMPKEMESVKVEPKELQEKKGVEESAITEGLFEEVTELSELEIAQEELEKSKNLLNGLLREFSENDRRVRKQKVIVAALASFICNLDLIENPPEEPEQPELPTMKNNDQRKEWLRNYKDWGLWYEDTHIGVRYYKYEFENGAVLIAEEFSCSTGYMGDYTTSYLHLIGGPKPPNGKYGCGKWQRHERYSRYPNNETELVEFLKEIQKNGQK